VTESAAGTLPRATARAKRFVADLMPARRTVQRALPGQTPPPPHAFARFGDGSWIVPSAIVRNPDRVAVGARVVVLEHSALCVIDDDRDAGPCITLGDDVRLARFTTIVGGAEVVVADGVASSDGATILSSWRDALRPAATLAGIVPPAPAPVVIGPGAYLGCNAVIYPGVTVGAGSYVGEGAVVTADVPAHSVVYGNPATVVRTYDSSSRSWRG
jgi:acetyltransferase-like isoleucine patch superfamily enzyme